MHRQFLVVALSVGCGNVSTSAPDAGGDPGSDGAVLVPNPEILGGTLRNGCVVALHMDEAAWTGAAGEVVDDCGNDNAGTLVGTGTAIATNGVHGHAASFSGDGCIEIPNAATLHGTTGLTMSVWMFPTQLNGGADNANGLISKRNDADDQNEYSMSVWTGFRVYVDLDGKDDRFASPAVISTNTWTQVTVVYDGTQAPAQRVRAYISGDLNATQNETKAALPAYTSALHIGCTPAPGESTQQGFIGKLDEAVIWNRALTETEVRQWYVNTKP